VPLLNTSANNNAIVPNTVQDNFVQKIMSELSINNSLNSILLFMLLIFIIKGITRFVEVYYRTLCRVFFMKRIRNLMVNGFERMQYAYFIQADMGKVQNTMTVEVNRAIVSFENYFKAAQAFVMILVYIVLAFLANAQFSILILCIGLLSNLLYKQLYKKTKFLSKEISVQGHKFQGFLSQFIHHYKYLKATNSSLFFVAKIKNKIQEIEKSQLLSGKYAAILTGGRETISVSVVILVILLQVNVLHGSMSEILLSLLLFYRALSAILVVQNNWNSYLNGIGSLHQLQAFLKELKGNKEILNTKSKLLPFKQLEFKHIQFEYESEQAILKGISLQINAKETIAIVGESGSGKTTLVNVMAGLLFGNKGEFLINGISISETDVRDWRSKIGYITQEPVIFDDTLENNITLWQPLITVEQKNHFEKILKMSAVDSFANQLQDGLSTQLGNNGVKLSGGQKQRVSIARELYKNVDLLILDEATASLDSETENIIQESLTKLKGEITLVFIAHRLSTIQHADKIILMEKGEIKDTGTFEELNKRNATFQRMVSLQTF
jgi:subfamily B ATP-binding cassette protein MsbA